MPAAQGTGAGDRGPMLLETYELTALDIRSVALDDLHALSIGVRWPHRADDWRFLMEHGEGIAAQDEIGRIVGSAMWFPYSAGFATIGMVITSPRLQAHGTGRWLMRKVMAATGERALGLNATRAAHRLYRSLGFVDEATVHQMQGEVAWSGEAPPPPAGATLRAVRPDDLPALAALDAAAFGTGRPDLTGDLLARSDGTALVREGRVAAFALCRRFGRGHVVGPLVAESDEDALAVLAPLVSRHHGAFLRLDTRHRDGAVPAFLARHGLSVFDTVTTMWRGRPWPHHPGRLPESGPLTYALAAHALS